MRMNNKQKVSLVLAVLALCQVPFLSYFDVEFLKYECLVLDVLSIAIGYYVVRNLLHPYVLFLLVINLFLCSRIWIEDIIDYPFYYTTFLSGYPFTTDVQQDMLCMLILSFIGLNMGLLFYRRDDRFEQDTIPISLTILKLQKWVKIALLLITPLILFRFYETWSYVSQYGYIALYAAQAGVIKEASWLDYMAVVYQWLFFVFLATRPSRKKMLKFSVLFLLVISCNLLNGSRGGFAPFLLLVVSYYSVFYARISGRKIVAGMVVVLVIFQLVGMSRNLQSDETLVVDLTPSELVLEFFRQQGVSITILGYADQLKDEQTPMDVLYPLAGMVLGHTDADYETRDNVYYSFPHKVTYLINPQLYAQGFGAGSSYIAELYSSGGFILLLGANILLAWLIMYFANTPQYALYRNMAMLIFLQHLFLMPRAAFLGFIDPIIKYESLLCIVVWLVKMKSKGRELC